MRDSYRTHLPDLLLLIESSMYGAVNHLFFAGDLSHPDLPSTKYNPFPKRYKAGMSFRGSALCFGATPSLLCSLARLIGPDG